MRHVIRIECGSGHRQELTTDGGREWAESQAGLLKIGKCGTCHKKVTATVVDLVDDPPPVGPNQGP